VKGTTRWPHADRGLLLVLLLVVLALLLVLRPMANAMVLWLLRVLPPLPRSQPTAAAAGRPVRTREAVEVAVAAVAAAAAAADEAGTPRSSWRRRTANKNAPLQVLLLRIPQSCL